MGTVFYRRGRIAQALFAAALLWLSGNALAVPGFARQTGLACATCHVGAFGPQLTDFGQHFKITGYRFGQGEGAMPLSFMAIGSYTATDKDQDPAPPHARSNNNWELDQASIFYAGKLGQKMGLFAQATYDGVNNRVEIDNVDLRFSTQLSLGKHSAIAGLTINNSPGVSDPWNTLPVWVFPFTSSKVAPGPEVATLLDGALAQRVIGLTGYAQIDGEWYVEIGAYRSLSNQTQARLGLVREEDPGILHGAVYGRVAVKEIVGNHSLAGGLVVFDTKLQPDRGLGAREGYTDAGLDVTYRWTPSADHLLSVQGNIVQERHQRDSLVEAGEATRRLGTLTEHSLTASYYWRNTWGLSLQRFGLRGDTDELLYAEGFAGGSPNWRGTRIQFDWTPYARKLPGPGFDPQWRLGLQYTAFDQFNGGKSNYDGNGRDARDNNTLYGFVWLVF